MALDSFFVNEIAAAATHAANAYYNGSGSFPLNPYEFGSEGHRVWRNAVNAAREAARKQALEGNE